MHGDSGIGEHQEEDLFKARADLDLTGGEHPRRRGNRSGMRRPVVFLVRETALQIAKFELQVFERLSVRDVVRIALQVAAPPALFFPEYIFRRVHDGDKYSWTLWDGKWRGNQTVQHQQACRNQYR